ncbi:MAG: hypothetical protein ACKVJK_17020, partial [Methylophagaceae bacterium]
TTNANGCDSTATLNLTINNSNTGSSTESASGSYDWGGVTYTTSGTYTNTYTNASGCDSIHTLNLTITNCDSTLTVSACDSYSWNDTVYTQSGTYSYTVLGSTSSSSFLGLSVETHSTKPTGETVYRLYADLDSSNHTLFGLAGTATNALTVNTTTTFFQDGSSFGGDIQSDIDSGLLAIGTPPFDNLIYDSWWTLGDSYDNNPTQLGDWTFGAGNFSLGGSFATQGALARIPTETECFGVFNSSTGTYRVLLGQFTTDGDVSGYVNLEGNNSSNTNSWSADNISFSSTGGSSNNNSNSNSSGCDSTYTLNLTIDNSTSSSISVTECDTYTWNGETYTTSGVYTFVSTNANDCDSTATLNLTINNSNTGSSSESASGSYDWGVVTYTTSGTYTNTYTNASGCDSIHTLNLTITNCDSTLTVSACDSYSWNDTVYTQSGTYSYTVLGSTSSSSFLGLSVETHSTKPTGETVYRLYADLDSSNHTLFGLAGTATNALTVNTTTTFFQDGSSFGGDIQSDIDSGLLAIGTPPFDNLIYDSWWTLGDSYDNNPTQLGDWTFGAGNFSLGGSFATQGALARIPTETECFGVFNSSTGTYRVLLGQFTTDGDVSGYVNLEGNNSSNTNSWSADNISFSSTGGSSNNNSNSNSSGCDSTYTLNLTIDNSTSSSISVTECDTYTWNGETYTTSGVYTFVSTNANDCDSTATLNLTINPSTTSSVDVT